MAVSEARLYLDWNAGAPVCAAAKAAALAAMEAGGNASSIHAEGRSARAVVETVRRTLAARFAVPADRVTFTSGGTEANAMALSARLRTHGEAVARLLVGASEHPAVLAGGDFRADQITVLPVDGDGLLDLDALRDRLASDPRPALVSVMAANNETGVCQPIAQIAAIVSAAGGVFHTDAVQAFGRLEDDTLASADLISLSGHKIGAPQGVGALVRRTALEVPALIRGGGQERGARGGTENVAAIAGFGASLETPAATPSAWGATRAARDAFEAALKVRFPDAVVFGEAAPRLPNTSLFAIGRTTAELALIGLDLHGIALSSGSACSSGRVSVSHVLTAMGVPGDRASAALRVSVGPDGAEAALRRFLLALEEVIVPMEAHSIF